MQEGVEYIRAAGAHSRDRELDRELPAVAVQRLQLDAPADQRTLAGLQEALQGPVVRAAVARRQDRLGEVAAERLLLRPTEGHLRLRVPRGDAPGRVDRDERVVGGVHDLTEVLLGLAQRLLG